MNPEDFEPGCEAPHCGLRFRNEVAHFVRDLRAAEDRADRAEAACAAMREALAHAQCEAVRFQVSYLVTEIQAALSSDAGRGWLSPSEAAKLRDERDQARMDAIEDCIDAYPDAEDTLRLRLLPAASIKETP